MATPVVPLAVPAITVGQPAPTTHTLGATSAASQPNRPPTPPTPPPAPTPTTIWLTADDGLTVALAFKQRIATTNPSYAASFGAVKYERPTSSGLKLVVWTVVVDSVVDQIWTLLVPSLISLIDAKKAKLEAKQPPESPENPSYAIQCYILGPDQARATPYVCVVSRAAWFRRAICNLVIKSAQLKPHGFKCVALNGDPGFLTSPATAQSSDKLSYGDPEFLTSPTTNETRRPWISYLVDHGAILKRDEHCALAAFSSSNCFSTSRSNWSGD